MSDEDLVISEAIDTKIDRHLDSVYLEELADIGAIARGIESGLNHKKRKKSTVSSIKTVSPTSASIILADSVGFRTLFGKCGREIWFKSSKIELTNPSDSKSSRRMSIGKAIEDMEQDYIIRGLDALEDCHTYKNVLFLLQDDMYGMNLFGEIDLLVIKDGIPIPIEIKSFYGYYQKRHIFGNKSINGKPKENHLFQISQYVYALSNTDRLSFWATDGTPLDEINKLITGPSTHGFIRYIERADCDVRSYEIGLKDVGSVDGFKNHIPTVEGNEMIPVTIADIFRRYKVNSDRILESEDFFSGKTNLCSSIPPRDSIYQYSPERLKYYSNQKDTGLLNKKERDEYAKNGTVRKGEFQCRYCDFFNICMGIEPWTGNYPSNEEIIAEVSEQIRRRKEREKEEENK